MIQTGKSVIENHFPKDNAPILSPAGVGVDVAVGLSTGEGVGVPVAVEVGVSDGAMLFDSVDAKATAGDIDCVGEGLAVLIEPRTFELA